MNRLRTIFGFSVAVTVCCVAVAPTRATVVEVPLPELIGTYESTGTSHTVPFVLPVIPSAIYSVSIRITGVSTLGVAQCLLLESVAEDVWPMDFVARFSGDGWSAGPRVPYDASGPFTNTEVFHKYPATSTWNFLLDGTGTLFFEGFGAFLVGVCSGVTPPSVVIESATLLVDGDFVVPVAESTWGKIKALYR